MSTGGRRLLFTATCALAATVLVALGIGLVRIARGDQVTVADVLVFAGALITAAISLFGHQRLAQEHSDNQEQLKLDAAMRAGAMFTSSDKGAAAPATSASALLALTELGQAELAVALLVDLWSDGRTHVSTETAILVIDAALRSAEKPNAQLVAAELLCRNATRLNACQSLHWPSVIDGRWDPRFKPKTKFLLLEALLLMSTTNPMDKNALRSIAVRLYGIWSNDPDPRIKGCIGMAIEALVPALQNQGYTDFVQGSEVVTLAQLCAASESARPNPDLFFRQVVLAHRDRLRKWAARGERDDLPLGSPITTAPAVGLQ